MSHKKPVMMMFITIFTGALMFMRAARYARKVIFFVSCLCLCLYPTMGRTKAKKGSKQTALTGSGFWPMLSKPAIAIGKQTRRLSPATCSSSVRAARQPRQSCTRMTLACSTPRETQRATWFRLPAARLSCDVRRSPCDAQREMLMNGIRLQA